MWRRQRSGLCTKVLILSVYYWLPPSPTPRNALTVLRLSTNSDSFRDGLERAITKIRDTKTVKYSIQHCCTAVANRRYLIDKN